MKLIADCGSTKIEWCLLNGTHTVARFFTPGMNALMLSPEEIAMRMHAELKPEIDKYACDIANVYFYGAGCVSAEVCRNVATAIQEVAPNAAVEVDTDLLAAARALCGHEQGIACIMGTGSNSCYYDGKAIADNVSPLGYILGDEGSGAVLGKLLVGDVLKRQLPADLCQQFLEEYSLDRLSIIQRVYREPAANKFLASLSPFLGKHIDRPEVRSLVKNAFKAFFKRNVSAYINEGVPPVANFVGSIAYYYRPMLEEAAAECGMEVGEVLKAPMDGLIAYHS